MVADCSTEMVPLDGNGYWIERIRGKAQAYAQLLIRGTCRLDESKPIRPIERTGLPTEKLRIQFDDVKNGLMPVRTPKSTANIFKESLPPRAEVAGKGGQDMMS